MITPDIMRDVIKELRSILQERTRKAPHESEQLSAEAGKLRREIARQTNALACPDEPPDAILQTVAQRSTRLWQLPTLTTAGYRRNILSATESRRYQLERGRR